MTYANAATYTEPKREPRPTQPGNGSKVAQFPRRTRKRRRPIIHRIARFVKRWRRPFALLLTMILIVLALALSVHSAAERNRQAEALDTVPEDTLVEVQAAEAPAYIFTTENGQPINWEAMTSAWAAEAGFEKRYDLTDEERLIVCQVVQAEAGGEPYAGMVAVAQCILQSCEDDGIRPDVAVRKYGYSKKRPAPSQEAIEAVQAVFDFGHVATTEPIKYFYAPDRTTSSWHETQSYVMTINGHRFFAEAAD